jgi:adenylate cyclase
MLSPEVRALWELIERRIEGGNHQAIDDEIWARFGGEWTVMATDLAGFSRQVAKFGIVHFLQTIHEQTRRLEPIVAEHGGHLVKTEADSMLILFSSAPAAMRSALAMQAACRAISETREPEDKILLCIGIGHGRLLKIGDNEVFGHEVNLASKLGEDTAKAHEILATPAARTAIGDVEGVTWEALRVDGVSWEEYHVEYAGESMCWRARYRIGR